jgi:hypothetical protein
VCNSIAIRDGRQMSEDIVSIDFGIGSDSSKVAYWCSLMNTFSLNFLPRSPKGHKHERQRRAAQGRYVVPNAPGPHLSKEPCVLRT